MSATETKVNVNNVIKTTNGTKQPNKRTRAAKSTTVEPKVISFADTTAEFLAETTAEPTAEAAAETTTETTTSTITSNTNIGELRGLLAAAREQGLSVAIVKIPVRLFAIDSSYQTPIRTERELGYLLNNFDERKLLPVIGVPHDEEGLIYLTDGYARWKVTQMLDSQKYESLQCLVILNAPTEPEARRKFEAEQYAFQNKNVAKMKSEMRHGALQVLGDPAVLAMDQMQKKYGFKYIVSKGQRAEGVMSSYAKMYQIARMYGAECLDYIFSIIHSSGFNRKTNGYSKILMDSLKDAWRLFPEHREETQELLSNFMRKYEWLGFKSNAISRYSMLTEKSAVSLYIEDLIVDQLALAHKRSTDGKSVSEVRSTSKTSKRSRKTA